MASDARRSRTHLFMPRSALFLSFLLAACGAPPGPAGSGAADPALVGTWQIYSEGYYYDAGGGDVCSAGGGPYCWTGTEVLALRGNGTWSFAGSSGTWTTAPIIDADWSSWGDMPYGPTEKLVLDGWNGDMADGPIETCGGTPDFLWVIYHVDQPQPAQIQMKLGH